MFPGFIRWMWHQHGELILILVMILVVLSFIVASIIAGEIGTAILFFFYLSVLITFGIFFLVRKITRAYRQYKEERHQAIMDRLAGRTTDSFFDFF